MSSTYYLDAVDVNAAACLQQIFEFKNFDLAGLLKDALAGNKRADTLVDEYLVSYSELFAETTVDHDLSSSQYLEMIQLYFNQEYWNESIYFPSINNQRLPLSETLWYLAIRLYAIKVRYTAKEQWRNLIKAVKDSGVTEEQILPTAKEILEKEGIRLGWILYRKTA